MAHVIIRTNKRYASYLTKHLQKEHPRTKGRIWIADNALKSEKSFRTRKTINFCEMCGRKMKRVKVDYRSANICKKCLKGEMKSFRRDVVKHKRSVAYKRGKLVGNKMSPFI